MKRILLVDDDPFILDIYLMQLRRQGFAVDTASSPAIVFEKIENNFPDLLILDLNLDVNFPGPSQGLEVLSSLRQNIKTRDLKIIVMSNYSVQDYPELSRLSDFGILKSFLKVQISPEEVIKEVKEILK